MSEENEVVLIGAVPVYVHVDIETGAITKVVALAEEFDYAAGLNWAGGGDGDCYDGFEFGVEVEMPGSVYANGENRRIRVAAYRGVDDGAAVVSATQEEAQAAINITEDIQAQWPSWELSY